MLIGDEGALQTFAAALNQASDAVQPAAPSMRCWSSRKSLFPSGSELQCAQTDNERGCDEVATKMSIFALCFGCPGPGSKKSIPAEKVGVRFPLDGCVVAAAAFSKRVAQQNNWRARRMATMLNRGRRVSQLRRKGRWNCKPSRRLCSWRLCPSCPVLASCSALTAANCCWMGSTGLTPRRLCCVRRATTGF